MKTPQYKQSSVIPLRLEKSEVQILLITSINGGNWIFPKGIIEKDLTAIQSAALEAYEEAGVEGYVPDILLGNYSYNKWGGTCHVQVFPMIVKEMLDLWPEYKQRERRWVPLKKALKMIRKKELRQVLNNLEKNLPSILPALESFPEK